MTTDSHGHSQAVGRPMEILLVEDNLMDAHATITALKDAAIKHRLTLMRDGAEPMEFLHRLGRFANAPRPDLILLDLFLPKKDGLEVLAEIRAEDDLSGIPVVVLTASDQAADQERCEYLDVDAFLPKPVNLEKFIDVVRQLKRYWMEKDLVLPMLEE